MSRLLRSVVLAGFALVSLPTSAAAADFWGWLESFSGPGPWHQLWSLQVPICPDPEGKHKAILSQAPKADPVKPCLFVDWRVFDTKDPDPLVGAKARAQIYESGVFLPVHPAVSVGAGAGVIRFNSLGVTTYKMGITPYRIAIRPLRLIPQWTEIDQKWPSLLAFYVRGTFVAGRLTGEDFGIAREKVDENWEFVRSVGFIVDVGELISFGKATFSK